MDGECYSLMDFIRLISDEAAAADIEHLFPLVGDSFLTTFLLLFLAAWIFNILIGFGKDGFK